MNLVIAVLESAIYEFRHERGKALYNHPGALARANAVAMRGWSGRWIFGDGPKPFGFRWCCAILDMDPGRVRHALLTRLNFRKKYATKVKTREVST